MKRYSNFSTILIVLLVTFCLSANDDINNHAKIKIVLTDQFEMHELARLGISLENITGKYDSGFELFVNYNELHKIKESGFTYDVIIPNIREHYKNRSVPSESEIQDSYQLLYFYPLV